MSHNIRESLIQEIEQAFAMNIYPGDENIGRVEIQEFRGDWKALPLEVIIMGRGELGFLTPEGFHYYLPAFLRAALLHRLEVDTLVDNLFYHLSISETDDTWETGRLMRIVALLTNHQKRVILKYFEHFLDLFPEDRLFYSQNILGRTTLETATRFWKQHLESIE
jgi:hypothetical protein